MNVLSRATALAVCVLFSASAAFSAKPQNTVEIAPQVRAQLAYFDILSAEPVDVIVQLADEPAAVTGQKAKERGGSKAAARAAQVEKIRGERMKLYNELRKHGIDAGARHEFEQVYNGFLITLPANKLPLLASLPGVVGIFPNVEVTREDLSENAVMEVSPELATSTLTVKAPAAWTSGIRGQGMKIAIIDDGVDYTHPDLGGCAAPGPGCKVFAGYDFIELDSDPINGWTTTTTVNPAPAPPTVTKARDYHGSHVAAIAAGKKGVAPDASILAVRVLGTFPNGSGTVSNLGAVMAGVEYALRNDVDVINMSIGIQNFHAQSVNPYSEVTANTVRAGVVWVNSNGNDGPLPYKPNVYGSSPHVIAVGNADARGFAFPRTIVNATGEALVGGGYGAVFPANLINTPLEVVNVGFGNTPASYAGKNLIGKIAIAMRGGAAGEDAAFVNKGLQAQAAGAAGLIVYNDAARSVDFTTAALAVPSFTLSYPNALKVLANPLITVQNFDPGAQMNSGSSRGPTPDLQIKPDVSAPGTDIVAAVPFEVSSTGYAALNGTSMAAPHVAGAATLLRQAHPDWTPYQVKAALMNTASNLNGLDGLSYRPIDQGAGLINIERALNPRLAVNQPSLGFGQLMPAAGYTATRTLNVVSSGTYQISGAFIRDWTGVSVTTSATSISAGASNVDVTVAVNAGAASGEYEGYINFVNVADANDTYRVPFLFVHDVPVSDVKVSKIYAISSTTIADSIDVTFNAGRPLIDWYLGSFPNATGAHTRFTANQGALAAGSKTITWNGRTPTGGTLGNVWSVGVYYKLQGQTTFTFGTSYARVFFDNAAPGLVVETVVPALTSNPVVTVRGAVGDSGMFTWGEPGGSVFVNGQKADLYPRVPGSAFGIASELAFEATVTLQEGPNTITIYAMDAAGNRSPNTVTLTTTLDTQGPVVTFTGAGNYTVDQSVRVTCTATDTPAGVAGTPCAEPLLVKEGWELPLGTTTVSVTAADTLGNTTTATASVNVSVNFDALVVIANRFSESVNSSLGATLGAAKQAFESGNIGAMNNQLSAFQNHVAAQAGKKIPANLAAVLTGLAESMKK